MEEPFGSIFPSSPMRSCMFDNILYSLGLFLINVKTEMDPSRALIREHPWMFPYFIESPCRVFIVVADVWTSASDMLFPLLERIRFSKVLVV